MSRTYRDVLDERKVPRGPWSIFEDRTGCEKIKDKGIIGPLQPEKNNVAQFPKRARI